MFNRRDPFFEARSPLQSSYLESLHRTFSGPAKLPKRNEEAYNRALKFRQDEKARYAKMDRENARLRQLTDTLNSEVHEIKSLWGELSKQHADAERNWKRLHQRNGPADAVKLPTGTGDVSDSGAGVGQRTKARTPGGGNSDRVVADSKDDAKGATSGRVQREVLPPDARGQADEHAPEGSERGGGPDTASEEPVSENTV
jgi:hypothetical protein